MIGRLFAAGVLALVAGGVTPPQAGAFPQSPQAAPVAAAAPTPNGAWTTYHHDGARTGFDSTAPPVSGAAAGWVSPVLDGQVYSEPLVYNGLVYVATLQNTVYALNQSTGAVVWSKNLGAPQTSGWQCGNVNPTGILGTGVIDTAASRIYVVPFLHQFLGYYLFGLDLATGTVVMQTQLKPTGFDWTIQQERGALAMSTDGTHVYVPFGGRAGDCGPYHGWVDGVPTNGTAPNELYTTPSTGEGIWASGGVAVDSATGNVFFATGNAIPCTGAITSDSVIKTTATLATPTFFRPQDWSAHWCAPDLDLGSATPVLISPSLIFTSGKYGQGFLLSASTLGGTDGQLFPAKTPYVGADVCGGSHSDATFGSFAYAAPYVYLQCDGGGLVGLKVNTSTPSFSLCGSSCASPSWNSGGSLTFGPPIVAGGAVWVVDIGGSGLYGYNASTGAQIFHSASFGVNHFSTPSEAGGQIFVSSGTTVRSFDIVRGCASVSLSASPPSPSVVGGTVVFTATASGCPNPSPLYQFWMLPPGAGTWQLKQPYSTSATFTWTTSTLAAGTYRITAWARDASSAGIFSSSLGRWDTSNNGQHTLTATAPCSAVSASYSPASPQPSATPVTITASASGCPDANPLYQFWMLAPGASSWQIARPYSTNAVFTWNTTGRAAGTYRVTVWARDANSPGAFSNSLGSWDTSNDALYTLTSTPCASVSASAAPASPQPASTQITISAVASGCANPLYQFWMLAPGSATWRIVQGYTTSAGFTWTTTGSPAGIYRITVWVRDTSSVGRFSDAAGRWDASINTQYTLT
jgi:hypothetical protein